MLKILNNDKFTTAQNRHSLVSLKIPILNTPPYRTGRWCLYTDTQVVALGSGLAALTGRVFKIALKSYAFFAYSIDAFDYQVRRKVFNRPFLNMAVSSILQPFFEFEVNSSVLVG